jgi:SAM-dependent methyltransferase
VAKRKLDPVELKTIRSYDLEAEMQFATEPPPGPFEDILWAQTKMASDPLFLDVGCGHGRMVPCLREMGITRYIGIDPSTEMIRIARREYPGVDFREMDLYSLPDNFPPGHFDVFLAMITLSHVPVDKMEKALLSIRKVMKPGGVGVATFLNFNNTIRMTHRGAVPWDHPKPYATMRGWTLDRITPVLNSTGYKLLERVYQREPGYQVTVQVE